MKLSTDFHCATRADFFCEVWEVGRAKIMRPIIASHGFCLVYACFIGTVGQWDAKNVKKELNGSGEKKTRIYREAFMDENETITTYGK